MILRQALILSSKRDYVQAMRDGLREMGDDATRIDVEMDALRAMQLAPRHYDLIVLDAVMETMNGVQLLLLMKLQSPSTKFVIVSDTDDEEARAHAYRNGADFYLPRPRTTAAFRNGLKNIATVLERAAENEAPEGVEEPAQRLADIVQTRCLSGDSVILLARGHFQSGDIFIYRGEVFHAQYPGKSGAAAFHDMLHWDDGLVRVKSFRLTNIPPRTIEVPYRALLQETGEIPFVSDLRPPGGEVTADEFSVPATPFDVMAEAPALAENPEGPPFLPDVAGPGGTEMPQVNSYWKVNLTGELVEGSRIAEPERFHHDFFISQDGRCGGRAGGRLFRYVNPVRTASAPGPRGGQSRGAARGF
jgi:CheY-like chemotaxis protein